MRHHYQAGGGGGGGWCRPLSWAHGTKDKLISRLEVVEAEHTWFPDQTRTLFVSIT